MKYVVLMSMLTAMQCSWTAHSDEQLQAKDFTSATPTLLPSVTGALSISIESSETSTILQRTDQTILTQNEGR